MQITTGLIIDQYHGGGKADQILFRGFDSDNGTIKVNARAPILEKHLTILAYNYHFDALLGITGAVVGVIGSFDFISASCGCGRWRRRPDRQQLIAILTLILYNFANRAS